MPWILTIRVQGHPITMRELNSLVYTNEIKGQD